MSIELWRNNPKDIVRRPNGMLPKSDTPQLPSSPLQTFSETQRFFNEEEPDIEYGTRKIVDSISPDSIQIFPDFLVVNGKRLSRTGFLEQLPEQAEINWWEQVYSKPGIALLGLYPYTDKAAGNMLMGRKRDLLTAMSSAKKRNAIPDSTLESDYEEDRKVG